MLSLRALLLTAALAIAAPAAQAMTMIRQGDTMVMAGAVVHSDFQQFIDKLKEGPLKRVILLGSRGGDSQAAFDISERIRRQQISTVVAGPCVSACALIFMGGVERQMMGGKTLPGTRLGFHAPHYKETRKVSDVGTLRVSAWLKEASDGKFSGELLARAMKINRAGDVLFFYYPDPATAAARASVWFCDEGIRTRTECERLPGVDAVQAGILTSIALFPPDTPIYAVAAAQAQKAAASAPQEAASAPVDGPAQPGL
jgi:hypothetical protein